MPDGNYSSREVYPYGTNGVGVRIIDMRYREPILDTRGVGSVDRPTFLRFREANIMVDGIGGIE